MLYKMIKVDTT